MISVHFSITKIFPILFCNYIILLLSYFAEGKNFQKIFVPRFCHTIDAELIQVSDDEVVATIGGMIIGNVVDCEDLTLYNGVDNYCIDLIGEFSQTSGECDHYYSTNHGRGLDVKHKNQKLEWEDSVVYYEFKSDFPKSVMKTIEASLWMWTQSSPARFIESTTAPDRLQFTALEDLTCISYIGKIGGKQMVGFHNGGGCNIGRITHEIGHALGFYHEHTRPDRKNYIVINQDNILEGYTSQYKEVKGERYGKHDYDYGSLMHYPAEGFARESGKNTIEPVEDAFEAYLERYPNELPSGTIGQRFFLSTIDKEMGYTYLGQCQDTNENDYYTLDPEWFVGPWGGCEPQCPTSYRQRNVFCRAQGKCLNDTICDLTMRPASRRSCELGPGITNVTFEENQWGDVGVPMQNVPLYDQFDWYLWSGYPAKLKNDGNAIDGSKEEGPGTDADGEVNGRYLWFSSQAPSRWNDEAWYESPIVATRNTELCEVIFSYFMTGKAGSLKLVAVPCSDCTTVKQIWKTTSHTNQWKEITVQVPQFYEDIRLRFIAHRGESGTAEFGLDNIYFSAGCVRPEEEIEPVQWNSSMTSPYVLDHDCIYISELGFILTWLFLVQIGFAGLCGCCCCFGIYECHVRIQKVKQAKTNMKDVESHEEHHKLRMHMKKHHHHNIMKGSLNGMFERAKKVEHAMHARWNKLTHHRRQEDVILSSHACKQATSIHEGKKVSGMMHFGEKSGLFDRLDCIIKVITCGKKTNNPWHVKEDEAQAIKDLRSH
mmetsp:Transcript_12856/g.16892  ORF Transcript_12856/g.16892 Transcript_12856/m.16892 type:complete len:769 (+) Transcript_12856:220-2526(+)